MALSTFLLNIRFVRETLGPFGTKMSARWQRIGKFGVNGVGLILAAVGAYNIYQEATAPPTFHVELHTDASHLDKSTGDVGASLRFTGELPRGGIDRVLADKDPRFGSVDALRGLYLVARLSGVDLSGGDPAVKEALWDGSPQAFHWNCKFEGIATKNLRVEFLARLSDQSAIVPLAAESRTIEIVGPGGFTYRELWAIGVVVGFIAFLGGIIAIIRFVQDQHRIA